MKQQKKPKLYLDVGQSASIKIKNWKDPKKLFVLDLTHDGIEKTLFLSADQWNDIVEKVTEQQGDVKLKKKEVYMYGFNVNTYEII